MAYFSWTDKISVNIDSIDRQHRQLIDIMNELHDLRISGKAEQMAINILVRLRKYTKDHFSYEERLFAQYGFAGAEEHKNQHADLVRELDKLIVKANAGNLFVSRELFNFLKNWLEEHIMGTDMKYTAFLIGKGVR